jgi:hypothetical protein
LGCKQVCSCDLYLGPSWSLAFQVSRTCSRINTRSTFAMTARHHYNIAI